MLKLYMAPNSICTQKVPITLAEKGLHYERHELNLFRNEIRDRLCERRQNYLLEMANGPYVG